MEVAPKIVVWKISSKSHGNGMSKRAAMKLATRQSIVPAAAPSSRPESESHPRFDRVSGAKVHRVLPLLQGGSCGRRKGCAEGFSMFRYLVGHSCTELQCSMLTSMLTKTHKSPVRQIEMYKSRVWTLECVLSTRLW